MKRKGNPPLKLPGGYQVPTAQPSKKKYTTSDFAPVRLVKR
jgi:hypothetical protein